MTVSGGTIEQNNAENGAGIHNGFATVTRYIIRTDSELILTSCFVQENQASEAGGGAFNEGIMTCGEANFINNQSATLGGGIHSTGELDSNGCLFEKNSTGFDGGGICSYGTSVIRGSEFTYNTSTRGAGLASVGGNANISGSTFLENTALESGGGIFNMGSALGTTIMNIVNTELEKNQAMYGGGVASSVGDTRLVESTLSGNTASKNGGGVYNGGIMSVEEILFNGNEASDVGGGIFNFEEVNVLDSTFKGNQATGDGGGFNNTGTATLTGSTFVDNRAANGGGLASPGGDTALTNDTFSGNAASGMGGGIYVGTPEGSSLSGQTLASFITVAYNNAADGGGVATGEGAISIKNSIVAMNVSGGDCSTASGFSAIAENIESDGSCSGFSIKDDPLLDVLANYGGPTDTHALQAGSPAIDEAPDCTVISGGAVFVDQRGIARPGGLLCDLGAYEDESGLPAEKQDPCTFTAIINLNCRLGPDDTLYPIIDSFKEGESALVVGQSWDKVFAYVEGPINKEICAVPATSKFGVLEGECEDVPVMEAPEIDETYDAEEPTGCTVYGQSGELICVVPCPKVAKPGTPCTR